MEFLERASATGFFLPGTCCKVQLNFGYRRQMTLLMSRMRVGLLGEGVDERQVVCLDGEG